MLKCAHEDIMQGMKSSGQIVKETGMSKERVAQYARSRNLPKLGSIYMWDEDAERDFKMRMGMRGHKLDRRKVSIEDAVDAVKVSSQEAIDGFNSIEQ